jgi:hypothetical protein
MLINPCEQYVYMGILRVVIPDELEERLRQALPAKKGAISEFVAEAIKEKLDRIEKRG